MQINPTLTNLTAAFAVFVQPALANWTYGKNGEATHYKGIALEPIPTVEQARAATEKRLAAIKAEEGKQAAESEATRATAPQELFFTGKPYLEETGQYLFLFRHYDPELARWTTADPSGFPDGANNRKYLGNPISSFDWQGLVEVRFGSAEGVEKINIKWQERYGIVDMGIPGGPTVDWFETGARTERRISITHPTLPDLPSAHWVDDEEVIGTSWTQIAYTEGVWDPILGSSRWATQVKLITSARTYSYQVE